MNGYPEATAMGAGFATGSSVGMILALLIALQHLPEGFNAYRELIAGSRVTGRRILLAFAGLVPLGPMAGLVGYYWLSQHPPTVGFLMLFAGSGGRHSLPDVSGCGSSS